MPSSHPLKVLILEDRPGDCELLVDELAQAGFDPEWQRIETEAEYLQLLHEGLDLILADYTLPQFDAPRALYWLQQRNLDIPFIVVTGTVSEEAAVACMKQGAADYLLKDRLTRLGQAVEQALQAKRLRDEKRAADIALQQELTLLRTLIDNMPDYVFIRDTHSRFIDANLETVAKMGAGSLDVLIGKTDFDFYPEEIAAEYYADDQHVIHTGKPLINHEERTIDRRTGTLQWLLTTKVPLRDKQGTIIGLVGLSHDITDRKRAEQALRQSEERFSKAFHASPAGIFIVQMSNGLIVDVNESFIALTGYARGELVGRNIVDINLWDNEQAAVQLLPMLNEQGSIRDREENLRTKAGTFRHILASAELIDLGGEPSVLALMFDVTDRDRVQEERMNAEVLRVELGKERELLTLKEQFLSKLSHDFRTPLAVIQASSDLLSQYFDRLTPEKRLRYAHEIQAQIKVMTDMMEEVLVINRAQSGKLGVHPSALNLVDFCRTLFEDMQLIDTADHDFVFKSDDHFDNVAMDEKLLRHILVNLLTNAIKYSPNGGTIRFNVTAHNSHIVFQISDQGIGIPEEDKTRLFEEFYRAKNTGTIAGTGLGLSIVKRSVEAHGGTMEVESKVGIGTTFTVHLPANFKLGQP